MKGSFLILLYLIGSVCCAVGYRTSELYRALNITCYGEDQLKRMCASTATPAKVGHANTMAYFILSLICFSYFLFLQIGCAWPSTIEAAEDQCAVLYQLITPSVACDLASRGLQPHFNRRLYSEWWSNSPLVTPNRLSHFIFKIKQGLVQNFSVYFMVRRIVIWLHAKVCSVAGVAIT